MISSDLTEQFQKWQLQLRKGVLIYMVLSVLNKDEHYGYSLISALSNKMDAEMAEGTIYPLLNRMVRNKLIEADWRIMESGPARKYYQITSEGKKMLNEMHKHWRHLNDNLRGLENE